jgi:hypothetical protein
MNLPCVLVWTVLLLNLFNCFVQTAIGLGPVRIVYSFLNILIFAPLVLWVFYRGLLGLLEDVSYFRLYKLANVKALCRWC